MNLQKKNKPSAEIFTSAMNDIMFFLMLFFIIVSTLLSPNVIKLNLPSAKNTQSLHKKEILLSVNKDLQYFVNNKQVPFDQLQNVLAVETSKDKEAFVVLRCDNTLAVQQLVNVLEIGNKLNVKMILATRKEQLIELTVINSIRKSFPTLRTLERLKILLNFDAGKQ